MLKKLSPANIAVIKNTNWLLFEKVISAPCGLLLSIVLARYLGTDAFGNYSYLVALVLIIVPLAALGLNAIITRELVNQPDKQHQIMGTALAGRFIGTGLGALVLVGIAFWDSPSNKYLLLCLAAGQIFSAFTVFNFWFQAKMRNNHAVFSRLLALLIGLSLKLLAVYYDMGIQVLILLYSLDFLFVAIFNLIFYLRDKDVEKPLVVEKDRLFSMIGQSKWLIMSSVATVINLKIDIVMLQHLSSSAEAGIYSVAARISEVWFFIPIAITASYFPILLKKKSHNLEQYKRSLQTLNDILLAMAVAIIVPTLLFSEFLIVLLFGEEYRAAAYMLNIHIFGGIFIFMRTLLSKWLIAEGILKFSLVTHGIGAICNIGANFLLIPEYGGVGAAWASVFSYAVASYFALFVSATTRPMGIVMTKSLIYPVRFIAAGFNKRN
ncbi:flippase [Planctobacterium marinum]|uniref:O-unit flippase n=1 Tax=Planctobacterium marinum TaxID=1631968 RepID=A0AA48HJN2_9ALTE|nr:O-unit flippase [Planctobacterium marinum]